jgi:putative addiction module killer protein
VVEIVKYTDAVGRIPFDRWLSRLRDPGAEAAVLVRLRRLSLGLAGDSKAIGSGVRELRVHVGPGYGVYFAWDGPNRVLLLGGGSKATQAVDIDRARSHLEHIGRRRNGNGHTKVRDH